MKTVKRVFQGIGILIGIFVLYLLFVAVVPGLSVPEQPLTKGKGLSGTAVTKPPWPKKDVTFDVGGTPISAWIYLPGKISAPVPCIIMGSGLGGTKDILLESYALRYQKAGYAVLIFDYRHFGRSGGEPRQLIWIPYQLEDWSAAIRYARSLEEIDPARIALWGTSLSGGHVIVAAARDHKIACVSAQCPGLDGRATAEMAFERSGIGYSLRLMMHGQRDIVRSWLGLSPHKIPIVGKPGTIALMTTPDAFGFFEKVAPPGYINEACARIIIRGDKYRPVKEAPKVRCPVLLQIADYDAIVPKSVADEAEKALGGYADVKHYPIGHFDVYLGENFERCVNDQLAFFGKHLQ